MIGFNESGQKKAASIADAAQRTHFLTGAIVRSRPRVSPQFDAAVARVRNCDMHLAATLGHISLFLRDVGAIVEHLQQAGLPLSDELIDKYDAIGRESQFAVRLVERYALASFPFLNKLRRAAFGPQKWERDGRAALAKGSFRDYRPG